MKKLLFMLLFMFSQSYMLRSAGTSSENLRAHLRFKVSKKNHRYRRVPPTYIYGITADLSDNDIIFQFDNDNYKNITITVSCNGMLLYTNFFEHSTNEDISITLPEELEEGEYCVTIENEEVNLVGYFTI